MSHPARPLSGPPARHLHALEQVHVALRRDARRLATAPPSVVGMAGQVARWWDKVHAVLDWHLDAKESLLFPALDLRIPDWTRRSPVFVDDHQSLRAAAGSVSLALAALGHRVDALDPHRGELRDAAAWFEELLGQHLSVEEQHLWPALTRALSVPQYRTLERRVLRRATPATMSFLVPWILDGLDPVAGRTVLTTMPLPVLAAGRTVLRWRYERLRWW